MHDLCRRWFFDDREWIFIMLHLLCLTFHIDWAFNVSRLRQITGLPHLSSITSLYFWFRSRILLIIGDEITYIWRMNLLFPSHIWILTFLRQAWIPSTLRYHYNVIIKVFMLSSFHPWLLVISSICIWCDCLELSYPCILLFSIANLRFSSCLLIIRYKMKTYIWSAFLHDNA
jgi:hypothetical protein